MIHDPKTIALAILGGITPSLLWLWFWLHEDDGRPEPKSMLILCFILGIVAVVFVLPIEQFIQKTVGSHLYQIISWSAAEEIIKYLAVMLALFHTGFITEPIDFPIYIIVSALGFAALENTLFLLKPFSLDQATVGLLTGHLRFLGATLLHTVSSGIVGISIGLSYGAEKWKKAIYLIMGLACAITLHSVFNFFIMKNNGADFLKIFGFLWVVTIMVMLVFEKLRRMSGEN